MAGLSKNQFIAAIFFLVLAGLFYYGPFKSTPLKSHGSYLVGELGRVTLVSEQGHILRRWTVPFPVHKVTHNTSKPWQMLAVEENGASASLIDARSRRTPEIFKAPEGLEFNGHGLFSIEGDKFFMTAEDRKTSEGFILIYDGESLGLIATISSGGFNPHDLQYDAQDSKLLLVVNTGIQGQPGSLSWISEANNKITKSIAIDPPVLAAHFLQSGSNEIYISGSSLAEHPASALVSFGSYQRSSGKIRFAGWMQQYQGEILNIYEDSERQKIWLTLPDHDSILVLEPKNLNVVKEFKAEDPRSILAVTPLHPELLMISVATMGGDGVQKSFDLKNISGSDIALNDPKKFYAEHATLLEVAVQDY